MLKIEGKVYAAVIGGTNRPYILRDNAQGGRSFMPIFTTRLKFGEFKHSCPHGVVLEMIEFESIGAFLSRVGSTLKLALQQGLGYIAVDHPGPMVAHPAVLHLKLEEMLALETDIITLEVG